MSAWDTAASVLDPELPVLTIADLGILRDVDVDDADRVRVTITPTYSGCPAMETIRADLLAAFAEAGYREVSVDFVLAPAWSSDWISEAGRSKLEDYGIAPPHPTDDGHTAGHPDGWTGGLVPLALTVRCPRCGSPDTRELSRFGSTACKALWVCKVCAEPFDHFKAI